jgi:membrane fusion protein, multidrug efflux system
MRSLPIVPGGALLAACLVPFLLAGCDARSAAQSAPAVAHVRVRIAEVERRELAPAIHASGIVVDSSARTLSFAIAGVIADVRVDDGDTVRRGQVLARLELDTVNAQVSQTTAALDRAERELARARTLSQTGSIPRQMLDDAETASEVSRADARAASFARRHAVLVAPGDGVVLTRTADPGETVGAGTPILALALADEARVIRVSVTDRDIVRLHEGDGAAISLDAFPGRVLRGTVTRLAAAADPTTGLHAIEIASPELAQLPSQATAGLVARVELEPSDRTLVTLVPPSALLEADEREGLVWAVRPGSRSAVRKQVSIAFLVDDRVAIRTGLEGVSHVVTDGASYVRTRSVLDVASPVARSATGAR